MRSIFLTIAILMGTATVAAACPAWQLPGRANYTTSGQDLYSPNRYSVVAGGNNQLRDCNFQVRGYVISDPDFEFNLRGLEQYGRLEIEVNGECDTVLLVNDAFGEWHFDDDSNGNLQPVVNLYSPASGVYDIWVGTYNSGLCNATLEMETWYN